MENSARLRELTTLSSMISGETALPNVIEAGSSEKETREISRHKTRYVFDPYHIVSERRRKQLAERLEVHLGSKEQEVLSTVTGPRQNAKVQ